MAVHPANGAEFCVSVIAWGAVGHKRVYAPRILPPDSTAISGIAIFRAAAAEPKKGTGPREVLLDRRIER